MSITYINISAKPLGLEARTYLRHDLGNNGIAISFCINRELEVCASFFDFLNTNISVW